MLVVARNTNIALGHSLAKKLNFPFLPLEIQYFGDGELTININRSVKNEDIIVVLPARFPIHDHLMESLFIINTLKNHGAKKIIAVMPYIGYSRQSNSLRFIKELLICAGVNVIVTADLHTSTLNDNILKSFYNIEAYPLWLPHISCKQDLVIVSPDQGSSERARKLASLLNVEVALLEKKRCDNRSCIVTLIKGAVYGKNCLILDDIVDSGETLLAAASLLKELGAISITACVTHGILSNQCLDKLKVSTIKNLFVTDSIYSPPLPSFVRVISLVSIIADKIKLLNFF